MKENLQEMATRGVAGRWPVLLGGAALTRAYVEDDLRALFAGEVHYARDAFEGLSLMDRVMAAKRGGAPVVDAEREAALAARAGPARAAARHGRATTCPTLDDDVGALRRGRRRRRCPRAPFFGTRVVKGIPLADYAALLDERATFLGQWGLRGARGGSGPSYEELVETEGRPRLRYWLDRLAADQVLEAAVVYGYFPAYSEGNDAGGARRERRAPSGPGSRSRASASERRLCLADFFRPRGATASSTWSRCSWSRSGSRSASTRRSCSPRNAYRDYLEVHGLSVQLTEALAEYWHRRIRSELVLPDGGTVAADDPADLAGLLRTDYRGCRYSFGYPACPDLEDRAKIVDAAGRRAASA